MRKSKNIEQKTPSSESSTVHEFLSRMGHELRTSIMGIIGYSEILIDEVTHKGCGQLLDDLKEINRAGKELLSLVNDLCSPKRVETLQRMESGGYEDTFRESTWKPIAIIKKCSEQLLQVTDQKSAYDLIPDIKRIIQAVDRFVFSVNNVQKSWYDSTMSLNGKVNLEEQKGAYEPTSDRFITFSEDILSQYNGTAGSILIVDDDKQNCDLLSRHLQKLGHRICVVFSGREALTTLSHENFDLVLLDVMMPEMNGYQVLKHIKDDENLRHIPVIMLSALDEIHQVVLCIEAGAEDYLHKPFNSILLNARINASLEKKRLVDRERAFLAQLRKEREKSEQLLHNILPSPIAERLKKGEKLIADTFPEVTVLFSDLVGFTELSTYYTATELVEFLNEIFTIFDSLAEKYSLEKIKTIGDAYMVVGGLPTPRPDHALAVAEMALDMLREIAFVNRKSKGQSLRVRIGIHTGPVIAGVIGTKKFSYDLWGDTVNIASRMESHGLPNAIQISEATYSHLKGAFSCQRRGVIKIKGKGLMTTYLLQKKLTT